MEYVSVTQGQRDGPFPDPACHDRQDDEQQRVARTETERSSDQRADGNGGKRAGRQRHEYLQKTLDKDGAIHPKNTANDDAGDEQIKKISRLREVRDRRNKRRRNHVIEDQAGRQESGKDRPTATIL